MSTKLLLRNFHATRVFYLVILFGCCNTLFAQAQGEITGRVADSTGLPLQGVSVFVKGTQRGTTTNAAGIYSIAAKKADVLTFRMVGYAEQEIAVGSSGSIDITLFRRAVDLGEVVVIGYGTQKKETVTGAIASIQTKEIKQSPAANLAVTLAGRLPGLTSIQRSGEPGRDLTQLFIRGVGTINAQAPIILVDGVERDLTYIDPNEVESVTILKDASSTAIFGVRGANGVILVTTKRGTSEKPEINLTAEAGMQDFPRMIEPVNSYEYASLRNLAQRNDGVPETYSPQALEYYRTGEDPLRYPNTNWNDLLMKKYSFSNRYNLNVSGAGKAVRYFVNAGYLKQGGQFKVEKGLPYDPSFKLDRYNFRSNIDIQLSPTLTAFLNIAGYIEKQNMPSSVFRSQLFADLNAAINSESPTAYIFRFMNALPATIPGPLSPAGDVVTFGDVTHPAFGQLNRSGYIQQTRTNVTATYGMNKSLDFITEGLSAKAIISFDSKMVNNFFAVKNYKKALQVIDPNIQGADGGDSVYYVPFNSDINTPLAISGGKFFNTLANFQGFLNYARKFNKHSVTGLLLYQQQKIVVNEELPYNSRGVAARFSYSFANKYFFEFNAGYNGSEQFAKGNRFGFFPALSAAWNLSKESFLVNSNFIRNLKLRGSYGIVGNDRIGGRRFLYLDDIQVLPGSYIGGLGDGNYVNIALFKNAGLQWEESRKTNVGLELALQNGFEVVVDLFYEKRDNILRSRGTIPILNGLPLSTLPPVNIGVISNKGYEVELSYKKAFRQDFSLLSKINFNYAKNKQLYADEVLLPEDFANRYRETGYSIGQRFGYITDGYFIDDQDIANSPVQSVGGRAPRPGEFKYKDLNGDNIVNEKDMAPIGYPSIPQYTFGAAVSATFKGFDVSILFQGVTNVSQYFQGFGVFATQGNYVKRHLNSWTEERQQKGEEIDYPRLSTIQNPNEVPNDFFIVNASFIRLKNAEIGYTIPTKLVKKVGIQNARIYANGLNLFTWDKLPAKDIDPESSGNSTYPLLRVFNFGINVMF